MPTASFNDESRRLVMRYENADTFSFSKVRNLASDQAMFDLAQAFASIQSVQPTRISSVVVQRLMI